MTPNNRPQALQLEVGDPRRLIVQAHLHNRCKPGGGFPARQVFALDHGAGVQGRNPVPLSISVVGDDAVQLNSGLNRGLVAAPVKTQGQVYGFAIPEFGHSGVQFGDLVARRRLPVVPNHHGVFHRHPAYDCGAQRLGPGPAGPVRVRRHKILPVADALLIAGQIKRRAAGLRRVYLVLVAQQRQGFHSQPSVVGMEKDPVSETRRVAQVDPVDFQSQPRIQADGDVALKRQGAAGAFEDLGGYPVLVLARIYGN